MSTKFPEYKGLNLSQINKDILKLLKHEKIKHKEFIKC